MSRFIPDSGVWQKETGHQDTNSSVHIISVDDNQIKLGIQHFSKKAVSAKCKKNLELLVFQDPASLDQTTDAYITVYAVPAFMKEVNLTQKRNLEMIRHALRKCICTCRLFKFFQR